MTVDIITRGAETLQAMGTFLSILYTLWCCSKNNTVLVFYIQKISDAYTTSLPLIINNLDGNVQNAF